MSLYRQSIQNGLRVLILLAAIGVLNSAQALDENSDTVLSHGCASFAFDSREFSLCAAIFHLSVVHPSCFSAVPDIIVSSYVNQSSGILSPDTVASKIGQNFLQEESCPLSSDNLRNQFDVVLKNSPAAKIIFRELVGKVMPDRYDIHSVLVPADTFFQELAETRKIIDSGSSSDLVEIHLHSDSLNWVLRNKFYYLTTVRQLPEEDGVFIKATEDLDLDHDPDLALVLHPEIKGRRFTPSWKKMVDASLRRTSRYALFVYRDEKELPAIEHHLKKYRQPFTKKKQICLGGISQPVFDKRGPTYKCAALFRRI